MSDLVRATALCVVPYFLCKLCVAANTAAIEYLFGRVRNPAALASEGATLHWEFLWMGACMGGARAASILVATALATTADPSAPDLPLLNGPPGDDADSSSSDPHSDPHSDASGGPVEKEAAVQYLFRGRLRATEDAAMDRAGDVANVAWALTSVYGVAVAAVYWHSGTTFFIARHVADPVRAQIADYGRGFAFAVLPVQWLYLNGQVALGAQAAGVPLAYDGIVNSGAATAVAWALYGRYGTLGLGLGMAAGAWAAWAFNAVHFAADPSWRRLGVSALPLRSLTARTRRVVAAFAPGGVGRQYLWYAVPLCCANVVGLAQSLVTATLVTQRSDDAAWAASIAGAYYQTLSIAMLGGSTVCSAVVAAKAPLAAPAAVRRRCVAAVCGATLAIAAVLAVLPLLAPRPFAVTFGGRVYAMGPALAERLLPTVGQFNRINAASFVASAVGMCAAAVMHAWGDLWLPTAIAGVGGAAGLAWAVLLQHHSVELIAWGGAAATALQVVLLLALAAWRRHRYFS